ncbi:hypothetical protein BH20ACT5_BH20ACT5_23370 [soil metagenome]
MTVLIGYVPRPEGRAALAAGLAEARRRGADAIVLNTGRGDALVDARYLMGAAVEELRAEVEAAGA